MISCKLTCTCSSQVNLEICYELNTFPKPLSSWIFHDCEKTLLQLLQNIHYMYIYICPASEVEITMMKLGEISGFLPYIDIYMKNNIYNYWFYHLKPYFNFYNHILFYFIVTLNSGHYRFRDPVLTQKLKLHPSWPWPWLTLMTHLVNWIWSAMFDAMRVNMLAWPMQSMLSIPWELGTDHSSSHG